jgi:hypothetical protein
MKAAVAVADAPVRVAVARERFYVRMAAACLAVGVIGFAPTYWIPLFRADINIPRLAHVHALLFFGWLLFFLNQTRLAASGAVPRHRELGIAGVALATGMFFVGTGMAVSSIRRFEAAGFGDAARAFSVVSFTGIVLFAVLFCLAIVNVKKPEIHKRLMLVATVSILQAAVGRWFVLFFAPPRPAGGLGSPPPVFVTVIPGLVSDLLIVAAMIHDRRTRGHIHPAYWIAGGAVIAVQLLRVPLSTTHAWASAVQWLVTLFP